MSLKIDLIDLDYGHTHNDEFKIFFDDSRTPPQPSGSLWIGASVTPYTGMEKF